jgi:DNA-binding beta-propeller fold protein YncE
MQSRWYQRSRLALAWPLAVLALLAACAGASPVPRATATTARATATPLPSPTTTPGSGHYTMRVFARGFGSPDDLVLDAQGRLLFADFGNDGVNRVELDGHITTLNKGLAEPEGIVALPNGTLIFAVQGTNGQGVDQLLRLAPDGTSPTAFATFANHTGMPGLDGISRDPATGALYVADSPNGTIYRVSDDGQRSTLLARGFVRPTDAIADGAGNVYVADEYGNRVARIAPDGTVTTVATLGLPDDLAFDVDGTLLVTVLDHSLLVRLNPATGQMLSTVASDLHEPQGLAVAPNGAIYVAEQLANQIVVFTRG